MNVFLSTTKFGREIEPLRLLIAAPDADGARKLTIKTSTVAIQKENDMLVVKLVDVEYKGKDACVIRKL